MKRIFLFLAMLTILAPKAFSQSQINQWVLEAINEMPAGGGYELTGIPVRKMGAAFTWTLNPPLPTVLSLDPTGAIPSYCTTATYMIFYKVLQRYWATSPLVPSEEVLERLKPNLEEDGFRIWGRWNANGPGTAKFFHDSQIGTNFDDIDLAQPGDFLKIYWNDQVGKKEKGHSVIYLGRETVNGVEMIRFWSSNSSTRGFGTKLIPRTDAIKTLFSRLTDLDKIPQIATIDENDEFLASMLTRISSWQELRVVTGIDSL